ncbi:MAG: hypothetical protein ACRDDZ_07920 [Marinifilaceae bacterium]
MKVRILTVAVMACMALLTACGGTTQNNGQKAEATTMASINIDQLLATADTKAGQDVVIEGVCTHICKHGGKKIFLMGTDDSKMIRIETSPEIGAFKQECVNSMVRVEGTLVEERIDEAYLAKWESEIAAQEEEKHGEKGEGGCSTEKKARGEGAATSTEERIASFRKRIAERQERDGKAYLSFYRVDAKNYEIK